MMNHLTVLKNVNVLFYYDIILPYIDYNKDWNKVNLNSQMLTFVSYRQYILRIALSVSQYISYRVFSESTQP